MRRRQVSDPTALEYTTEDDGLLQLLRLHPWTAPLEAMGEGQGWQEDQEEAKASRADLSVEMDTQRWSPIPGEGELETLVFVDGVRRVEAGLVAWKEGHPVWGLLGACAAGAVVCSPGKAAAMALRRERALVIGLEKYREGVLRVPAGNACLDYRLEPAGGRGQEDVRFALLSLMRRLEVQTAQEAFMSQGAVTVVDGLVGFLPLRLLEKGPIVGLIKEHQRLYARAQAPFACLVALRPGQRTPLFLLEGPPVSRYSWYVRSAPLLPGSHPLHGILRLETPAFVGLETAQRLAGLLAATIPRFSPPAMWDRRAPANLYPVAALEERLRHGLGDVAWVRRHIAARLGVVAARGSRAPYNRRGKRRG
jgi:hypothetical protein